MNAFEKLLFWQNGMEVVKRICEVTECLPEEEKYERRLACLRSALSIPANILEGSQREYVGEYKYYVVSSIASASELESRLRIILKRRWLPEETVDELLKMVHKQQKMLSSFINKL